MSEAHKLVDRIGMLRALDDADREKLAAIATVERRSAGDWLFRQDEPSDAVLFIVDGRLALSVRYAGRPEVALLTLGSGELAGWSALLPASVRVASARALSDVLLLSVPGVALRELCDRDHDIGYAVHRMALREVSGRLHDTRLQLLDLYAKQDER